MTSTEPAAPSLASLPVRTRPVDGELFRSYLARLARVNFLSVASLYSSLGIQSAHAIQGDLGMIADPAVCGALQQLSLITEAEIERLHPNPEAITIDGEVLAHPKWLRCCPRCVLQTGAFLRVWADPLQFVCMTCRRLLVDHAPGDSKRFATNRLDALFADVDWAAAERTQDPSEDLTKQQRLLDTLRLTAEPDSPFIPERMALRLITSVRDALATPASDQAIKQLFAAEHDHLTSLGYDVFNNDARLAIDQGRLSLWIRVETLALVAPLLIRCIRDANATGIDDVLDVARDDLYQISGSARKSPPSVANSFIGFPMAS